MEQFNLYKWLKDKSRKVIDDNGFPVEIIKWDANEKYPVVLLNHNGIAYNVSVDGMYDSDPNHGLFFAEEELTEFEKELEKFRAHILATSGEKYDKNGECVIKKVSRNLLDLIREEFIPKKQYEEDLDKAYKNADKVQFNRGMSEILNNPQKYFHVGDTIHLKNSNAEHTITSIFNGKYYGKGWSLDITRASNYELVEDCNEIKGWVARDCYGLWLYKQKPYRVNGKHTSHWTDEFGPNSEFYLDDNLFPELTWEDEPIEVELTIKKI